MRRGHLCKTCYYSTALCSPWHIVDVSLLSLADALLVALGTGFPLCQLLSLFSFVYKAWYMVGMPLLMSADALGRYGSGGKSCHLAVGGLPVRSHPGHVEVSLSKTPNPQLLLTCWLVPCLAANCHWVNVLRELPLPCPPRCLHAQENVLISNTGSHSNLPTKTRQNQQSGQKRS